MTFRFVRFATLAVAALVLASAAAPAGAQDTGGKNQDEKKQDEKKKDDKQDEKKQDEKKPDIPALMQEANGLRLASEFEKAGAIYKQVTEAAPENGMAWHLYGYCVHAQGKLDEAIKLHEKAAEFDSVKGISLYNLGCAYALKGDKEKALEYLKKSADAEYVNARIMEDTDLKSLHEDETFKTIAARLKGASGAGGGGQ